MPTIIRGADRQFTAICQHSNRVPLDLTNCTVVKATFIDENGEAKAVTLADGDIAIKEPKGSGMVEITLDKDFTSTLKLGERQDLMLEFTISGKEIAHVIEGTLTVKPKLGVG